MFFGGHVRLARGATCRSQANGSIDSIQRHTHHTTLVSPVGTNRFGSPTYLVQPRFNSPIHASRPALYTPRYLSPFTYPPFVHPTLAALYIVLSRYPSSFSPRKSQHLFRESIPNFQSSLVTLPPPLLTLFLVWPFLPPSRFHPSILPSLEYIVFVFE